MKNNYKHVISWILYSIFLFVIFNLVTDRKTASIRAAIIISTQLIVFYANLKWILPIFYEFKKYITYSVYNLLFLSLGIFLSNYFTEFIPFYEEIINENEDVEIFDIEIIFTHAMPIILVIFISFFLYTFQKRKEQEEKELAIVTAEKNFLVQQINPHFLFNTLNNIYSLTYKTAPKGSQALLQLSKMLDYSLYGEKEGKVSLYDEIAYVNNFIALFKLKDSSIDAINFNNELANTKLKIAPMLLLPFIENAFKHSNIEDPKKGFIYIELSTKGSEVFFKCTNSYVTNKSIDKTGGIGIGNVSRRLELLYPNKHQFKISKLEKEYIVSLKIDTNV